MIASCVNTEYAPQLSAIPSDAVSTQIKLFRQNCELNILIF